MLFNVPNNHVMKAGFQHAILNFKQYIRQIFIREKCDALINFGFVISEWVGWF